jgi:signal transduction histidine kinase
LSWKVNAAATAVICSALVLQALTGLERERVALGAEMAQDHLAMAGAVRHAVADTWATDGPEAAQALVQDFDTDQHTVRLRLVSVGDPNLPAPEVPTRARVSAVTDGSWRYTLVPLAPEAPGAALELRESVADDRQYLTGSALRIGVLLLGLIIGTSVVNFAILDRLVVQPVGDLVDHARRVGAGQLGSRSGVGSNDEMGTLAAALDRMAEALATAAESVAREQAEREAAIDQLRHAERLATVGRLAAGVAHELGTPLNVVLGRGRSIERWDVGGVDDARACGRIVADQAERMARIIRQLLAYARPRSGARADTDLRALATEAIALLAPAARRAGVALALVPGDAVAAHVDRQGLFQVVLNLATNAIDATPRGGSVAVRIEADDGEVRLAVSDTGTGIPPDQLPHVFEPFFTTKDTGHGTGLGLSVVDGIVRDHGGRVTVASRPGAGSTFTVHLPSQQTANRPPPTARPDLSPGAGTPSDRPGWAGPSIGSDPRPGAGGAPSDAAPDAPAGAGHRPTTEPGPATSARAPH